MRSLDLIWQQAQTGDRLGARKELARFLREQPASVQGWLLMATLLDEPAQQAECYRRVLRLDPQNRRALTMLQQLTSSATSSPVEVAEAQPAPPVSIPQLFEYTTDGEIDEEQFAALTREDMAAYVARELGSGADRNTLIRHICETGDMSWPEAERFVARVALENEHEIVKRQSSLMLVLGAGTLVGGVILFLAGVYMLVLFLKGELLIRPDFAFYGIVTGLGMVAGGLIGLVRTLKSLRDAGEQL
ncbi:MAG: hypothetical protein WHX52_13275 [Anaerolineae bacterium]